MSSIVISQIQCQQVAFNRLIRTGWEAKNEKAIVTCFYNDVNFLDFSKSKNGEWDVNKNNVEIKVYECDKFYYKIQMHIFC